MGWSDLLETPGGCVVAPWLGGKVLLVGDRAWRIEAPPPAHGWYLFRTRGRRCECAGPSEPAPEILAQVESGYLVGDRFISDRASVDPAPGTIAEHSEVLHLVDPGLDRFARVSVGRVGERGPLVFRSLEMPLGPEPDVMRAYLQRAASVADVRGVSPALDAAFRMETWRRALVER